MAKKLPQYEKIEEFNEIAKQLQNKYPEKFEGINIDRVCLWEITNKERSESKRDLWSLVPVKEPLSLLCPVDYYFLVYYSDWETLSEAHKVLLVAEMLKALPFNQEGKVNAPDVKGYSDMLKTFGVDYMNNEVPNILNEDIEWKE